MKRQIGKRFLEISFYFPFLLQKRHTNFFLSLSSPGNGHSCSPAAKSCVISKDHEKNFSEGICQLLLSPGFVSEQDFSTSNKKLYSGEAFDLTIKLLRSTLQPNPYFK